MMRLVATAGLVAFLDLGLAGGAPALAASFDCDGQALSPTQVAICEDRQLSRVDDAAARRLESLLRRLPYGPYLGLRHWWADQVQEREECGADRLCIAASYRTQIRFLDRLQQCLDAGRQNRGCLRTTLEVGNRESAQRLSR